MDTHLIQNLKFNRSESSLTMLEQATYILQKAGIDTLPSLPHVLLKALELIHQDNRSFLRLAEIIQQDSALTIKFITITNQSKEKTSTFEALEQRLAILGYEVIKSIIITSAVQQFFSRYNQERNEFLKQHWQHSLLCAHIARAIALHINYRNDEEAYATGLIHDCGQLIIECSHPKQYAELYAQAGENSQYHQLENDRFGTTHYHVGSLLLRANGYNTFIADAVLYHHEATDLILDAHPLVKIIHLSNLLSSSQSNQNDENVFDSARTLFDLSKADVLKILQSASEQVVSMADAFGIELQDEDRNSEAARQINENDQFKQVQLAEQVRNIALLDGTHKKLSSLLKTDDFIHTVQLQSSILFGVGNTIVFRYDKDKNKIFALPSEQQMDHLQDLSIPLEPNRSLITEAILNKKPLHSFDENTISKTVIDQQLAGLNDSEGLICIPMQYEENPVGVIVFGVNHVQQKQLWKQLSLLMQFANEFANSLHSSNENTDSKTDSHVYQIEQSNRAIAHEIRNPLSIINNYLEILGFKLDKDHPAHHDLNTIRSEISRINGILEKLSSPVEFTSSTTPIDINEAILELTNIFQQSDASKKSIQIELDLDTDMPHIICNLDAVKQIYTNLVKNAIEALPTNGQIVVYTQSYVNVNGKEYVEISVKDNGPGIAADILPELFSPIETEKGENHSGLGLSIVKQLVSDLHGTISCKSSKRGTSFHIHLPKIL